MITPCRGATLLEVVVALALFAVLATAAWSAHVRAVREHRLQEELADVSQSARLALAWIARDVASAGFALRWVDPSAPSTSDEAIELMSARAVLVRGNSDLPADTLGGRELELEDASSPAVTTGLDEIVGYVLGRDGSRPSGVAVAYFEQAVPRRGAAAARGPVAGEQPAAIDGVVADDTPLDEPPYTLHRVRFTPAGRLVRQPVCDGVTSLRFRYFDGAGRELAPCGGGPRDGPPDAPCRRKRALVRRVRVEMELAVASPDLRLEEREHDTLSRHRRLRLARDVSLVHVDRAGIVRGSAGPSPPEDVEACAGQCDWLGVSWTHAGDDEAAYLVSAHLAGPDSASGSASDSASGASPGALAAALVPAGRGPAQRLEAHLRLPAGSSDSRLRVVASVVARDAGGRTSEAATSEIRELVDLVRPEAPRDGRASGFATDHPAWPDVSALGAPVAPRDHDDAPRALEVQLAFRPPRAALGRGAGAPAPPFDWSTSGGDLEPALACSAGAGRTDWNEQGEPTQPNTYVFRVSASEPDRWGRRAGRPVGEARAFVPGPTNLHAFVALPLKAPRVTFVDRSSFELVSGVRPDGPALFVRSEAHGVRPPGSSAPPQVVQPGETYHYRVRVVDACWRDANRDGVLDGTLGTPGELTAWSRPEHASDDAAWRRAAVRLSPFYPPLASEPGRPEQPARHHHDSDELSAAVTEPRSLPGLARPRFAESVWLLPEPPGELALGPADATGRLLPHRTDASGLRLQGTRLSFNASRRTAPADSGVALPAEPVGIVRYRLFRKEVTLDETRTPPVLPSRAELAFAPEGATRVTDLRLRHPEGHRAYTIDAATEVDRGMISAARNPALDLPARAPRPGRTFAYRLVAVQAGGPGEPPRDGVLPLTPDGATPAAARLSRGSPAWLHPCGLQRDVTGIEISPPHARRQPAVVRARFETAGRCSDVAAARLLAFRTATGDQLGSSAWLDARGDAPCTVRFPPSAVRDALQGLDVEARFEVELSSAPSDRALGPLEQPRGCRVRSGLAGPATLSPGDSCTSSGCGWPGRPRILGPLEVRTEDDGRTLVLGAEVRCERELLELSLLEIQLESPGSTPPAVVAAELTGALGGPRDLPVPGDHAGPDPPADPSTLRLRWAEASFCDASGPCDFPVIDPAAGTIELRVRFDGLACAPLRVTALNFRVPCCGGAGRLLCSHRAAADESAVPPLRRGLGRGRGPLAEPVECTP